MKFCVFLITLAVLISSGLANEVKERPKKPLEELLPHVQPIEDIAIRLGNGPVKVHIFVDPFCPRSRDFITFISSSSKMLARYSYYFHLYRLQRFKSQNLIHAIYNSESPRVTMLDIMVRDKKFDEPIEPSAKTIENIDRVAAAAKKIDVYKRPYMIMVKHKKPKKSRG